METRLDLPSDLIDELQLHARSSGVDRDQAAADLLRIGLALAPVAKPSFDRPAIELDAETGFPVIKCRGKAPATQLTVDQLIALEHATQTQEDLERFPVSDRHKRVDGAGL